MKASLPLLGFALLHAASMGNVWAQAPGRVPPEATEKSAQSGNAIPLDQLGTQAQKQYAGDGISITPTANGAKLRTVMQDLEAEATREGLWLTSTADEDQGKPNRFRVRAIEVGRAGGATSTLASSGTIEAAKDLVTFTRPGLIEEYSVSADGVRQDFVVPARPAGQGGVLSVTLALTGASVEATPYGAKLTVAATGRELAYSRLKVVDATGKVLASRMKVAAADRLTLEVEDAGAVYPVRIDPTISDADWFSLGGGRVGWWQEISCIAADAAGNLYVGGSFNGLAGSAANAIAKWNGSYWSPLGTDITEGAVNSILVSGSKVYAGGSFKMGDDNIRALAVWDGVKWSDVGGFDFGIGMIGEVACMAMNNGALYVAGSLVSPGDTPANCVAKWDGQKWTTLPASGGVRIHEMIFMGGSLHVAEEIYVNGNSSHCVSRWTGSAWSTLGGGFNAPVRTLAVGGNTLYAGGEFTELDGEVIAYIAQWNGAQWSAVGGGTNWRVFDIVVVGGNVCATGEFTLAGEVEARGIAKWNGKAWSALGGGMDGGSVNALLPVGNSLYAVGAFDAADGKEACCGIARWDGQLWSALQSGLEGYIHAMTMVGSNLYVAGAFDIGDDDHVTRLKRWDGSRWWTINTIIPGHVNVMVPMGNTLYLAGSFSISVDEGILAPVVKWDGARLSALHDPEFGSLNQDIRAMAVIGDKLYVGGDSLYGPNQVLMWDGTHWHGEWGQHNGGIRAMAVSGNSLYVAGQFTQVGKDNVEAHGVARWDGLRWSALGTGIDGTVKALAIHDGLVFAGGDFLHIAGNPVYHIAAWDGRDWSPMGEGLEREVSVLAAHERGVFASTPYGLYRWNGAAWSPLSGVGGGSVSHLLIAGNDLYVGGEGISAGGKSSSGIAGLHLARADVAPTFKSAVVDATPQGVTAIAVVNPHGSATTVQFEYVMHSFLFEDVTTVNIPLTPANGSTPQSVRCSVQGLPNDVPYVSRFVARNAEGTVMSREIPFAIPTATVSIDPRFGTTILGREGEDVYIPFEATDYTGVPIPVQIRVVGGTAREGKDFYNASQNDAPQYPFGIGGFSTFYGPIRLNDNDGSEGNETFTVTIGGAFVTPGGVKTLTVCIVDSEDETPPPAPTITTPAANAAVGVDIHGEITVTGVATDDKGVSAVVVSNSATAPLNATLDSPGASRTGYTAIISGAYPGPNELTVYTIDTSGYVSPEVTQAFKAVPGLVVRVDASLGSVTPGFVPVSIREPGKSYTITATPKAATASFPGAIFTGWTVSGVVAGDGWGYASAESIGVDPSALEKPMLTFMFHEGLELTANFILNPFGPVAGDYNGLIDPSEHLPAESNSGRVGTKRSIKTQGSFKATLQKSGAFSGSLMLDGTTLGVTGVFDHVGNARFGTSRATTLTIPRPGKASLLVELQLDLESPGQHDQIHGFVTGRDVNLNVTAVSSVSSDRAYYNGSTRIVPPEYLGAKNANGAYTAILPSQPQASDVDVFHLPTGSGYATVSLTKAGVLTIAGTLADGAAFSAKTALSQANTYPLFAQMYAGKTGCIWGSGDLDHTQQDSDMTAGLIWTRPEVNKDQTRSVLIANARAKIKGTSINELNLSLAGSGRITIEARGWVGTGQWTEPELVNTPNAPNDGNLHFDFVARPPWGMATQAFERIAARRTIQVGAGTYHVVVHAGLNQSMQKSITVEHGGPQVDSLGGALYLEMLAAKYAVTSGESVLKQPDGDDADLVGDKLPPASPQGNASLYFEVLEMGPMRVSSTIGTSPPSLPVSISSLIAGDGGCVRNTPFTFTVLSPYLALGMQKYVNVNASDSVSKVPVKDGSFTLAINRATGLLNGTYTLVDGTKRPYSSMLYQKGQKSGSHGFFLVPTNKAIPSIAPFGAVQMMGGLVSPIDPGTLPVTSAPMDLNLDPVSR